MATPEPGSVVVIYGASMGLHSVGSDFWNQATPGIDGVPENQDHFGWALASGDINGDGYADLAIGAPGEDLGPGLEDAGAVHVLFGSSTGLTTAGSRLILSPDASEPRHRPCRARRHQRRRGWICRHRSRGAGTIGVQSLLGAGIKNRTFTGWSKTFSPGWRAGTSLAAGDFDSGGVDDLAAGFPAAGANEEGRVDVYTGTDVLTYNAGNISAALGTNDHLGMVLAAGQGSG